MIRSYDKDSWEKYWKEKLNLRGRCKILITIIRFYRKTVACVLTKKPDVLKFWTA